MSNKNQRLIYLPKEIWLVLDQIAVMEKKNTAQLVKDIIEKYVEEYKK